jgi:tetratricopeptide (TPR) repeat protein
MRWPRFNGTKFGRARKRFGTTVVLKSPRNGRGLMNYGNTLMAKGDYQGVLDYFHRAQQLTPQYSVLLVNLAIAEGATKQSAAAEQHFKEALRLAPASPDSYTYEAVNAMLLNEFLKEHRNVEQQQATIAELKSSADNQRAINSKQNAIIAQQQTQIDALTAGFQKVSAQLEASKAAPQMLADNQ